MDTSSRNLLIGLVVALVVIVVLAYAYRGSHVSETTNLPGTSKEQTTPTTPPPTVTPPAQQQPTPSP